MEIAICNDTMIVTEWLGFFNFFCTRTNAYVLVNDKKKKGVIWKKSRLCKKCTFGLERLQ